MTIDRAIFAGFLLLIAWLPLPLGSNRAWAWSLMEIWIYVLSLAWLLAYLLKKVEVSHVFHTSRPVIIFFSLWLCWIAFQLVPLPATLIELLSPGAAYAHSAVPGKTAEYFPLSLHTYATISGFLKSLAYVLIFCLTLLLVNRRKRLILLAYVVIIGATFQAAYGSLMSLSGLDYGFLIKKTVNNSVATGTFINPNHLACYLVMGLSLGIGLLIAKLDTGSGYSLRQQFRNWIKLLLSEKTRLRLCLVIIVIALVLTHSRMGNISFFVALLISGTIGLIFSRHATRSTVVLLASLIVVDLLIIGSWFGVEKVAKEVEETRLVTENRDEVYEYVAQYWKDYKLTGSGLGSFYSVFPKYRQSDVSGYYSHAHNDYLQFAAETGIIGILLLAPTVLISLFISIKTQYRRHDPVMRGMSFAAIMGITSMLIHATVDFNLQIPANAVTFMLLLAIAWISYSLNIKKS